MSTTSERENKQSARFDPLKLPPLDLNRRYNATIASLYLDQCLATTRKQIADGSLESFTDGRRRYIPGTAIAARSKSA